MKSPQIGVILFEGKSNVNNQCCKTVQPDWQLKGTSKKKSWVLELDHCVSAEHIMDWHHSLNLFNQTNE